MYAVYGKLDGNRLSYDEVDNLDYYPIDPNRGDYVIVEDLPQYTGVVKDGYTYIPYVNINTAEYEYDEVKRPLTLDEQVAQQSQLIDELTMMVLELGGALIG